MNTIEHANSRSFKQLVLQSKVPVLVDFYADWCSPCRVLSPILERLAGEFSGQLKIVKVDMDADPELGDRYHVYSIPTLAEFANGRMVRKSAGLLSEGSLRHLLSHLACDTAPSNN